MSKPSGLLSRFWKWLTANEVRAAENKHPDLYALSDSALAEELDLVAEAARLGAAGLPGPDETRLSAPEAQVVHRIERARLDYTDWANLRLRIINEDLSRLDVRPVVNRALQVDAEFARAASALLDVREPDMRALEQAALRRESELAEFRQRNHLHRDAHYPTGGKLFFRCALLAFLILLEGVANAFFFAQGVATGLLGGFVTALLLASVNVLHAVLQGRFTIPFLFHANLLLKLFGLAFLVATLVLIGAIGLGISHYRDALSVDAENAALVAINALKATPFVLHDLMSWALFAVSLLSALIALFDGLFMSDTYPLYGSKTRRAREAEEDLSEGLDELREELNALKEDSLKQLGDCMTQVQRLLTQQESLIQSKEGAKARLATALHDAEHCMDALLALFRQENQLHRGRRAAPLTFAQRPPLTPLPVPDFAVDSARHSLELQRQAADELTTRVETIRASIQAAFNREFDKLKPLGSQFQHARTGRIAL
ncbi:hypothetical protein AGMMS50225_18210 [Betaproteobacteria bacterium]|nr:hypothetical protein AGMMS50225_18210 [Betaproteobacteria bacterium]